MKNKNDFNIMITSNGFLNGTRTKQIATNKKILFVANAAPKESGNYIARTVVKENFEKIGAKQVTVLDIDENNVADMLLYDIIYVTGGRIGELIKLIHHTPFKQYVLEFLKRGIYIGESAGSVLLADDVKWYYDIKKGTKPKYDEILETYEGLNLTKQHIYPHYNTVTKEVEEKIQVYERLHHRTITKLQDGEFILEKVKIDGTNI